MKLRLLYIFIILLSFKAEGQGIVVDTTSYNTERLVKEVLLPSGCIQVTNFQSSSRLSVGYFNKSNSQFPIQEGIIIRSGIAKFAEGTYTGLHESSQVNTNSDPYLQQLSNQSGQLEPITDVAYLEFDFTPISNQFSFDFLFASNEYGEFQCGYSDVFAFVLTDLNTGQQSNLAVVPGTSNPISVKTIRNNAYNASCSSSNPSLFQQYNVNQPVASQCNMRGQTAVLNASAYVVPFRNYRIRLAIGDYKQSGFDSAVFIKGGSFQTPLVIGQDQFICDGENIVLDSHLDSTFSFEWSQDGQIITGADQSSYTIQEPGTYHLTASLMNGFCTVEDTVVISPLVSNTPNNVFSCYTTQPTSAFNLNINNAAGLGLDPLQYQVVFYRTLADAQSNQNPIPNSQTGNYVGANGDTIYIKIKKISSGAICSSLMSFELLYKPDFAISNQIQIDLCVNQTTFDLTSQLGALVLGASTQLFNFRFFTSATDMAANQNSIDVRNPYALPQDVSSFSVYVRVALNGLFGCYKTAQLQFTIHPLPEVDTADNQIVCSSYDLPPLTHGFYCLAPNGVQPVTLPYQITENRTVYIYNGPDAFGCANQSQFQITVIEKFNPPASACGTYVVGTPPWGHYYSAPHGQGPWIPAGTTYTEATTLYYYAEMDQNVCRDIPVPIQINPKPVVSQLAPQTLCSNFTIPIINDGQFYTESGGLGYLLPAGTVVSPTQLIMANGSTHNIHMPLTLYLYANNGTCANESTTTLHILDTTQFTDVEQCGPYLLPAMSVGGYFTQPNGLGTAIDASAPITQSKTVYYYAVPTSGTS